jgi:hypothetical protein
VIGRAVGYAFDLNCGAGYGTEAKVSILIEPGKRRVAPPRAKQDHAEG